VTGATTGSRSSRFTTGCEPSTGKTPDTVYAWTPNVSGTATISTCGATTRFDTVLSLRRGSCDSGQELACNDDTEGCAVNNGEENAPRNGSRVTLPVTAGETYYIVVDGYDGRFGTFTLTVTVAAPTRCTAASCDDGNACTTDTCNAAGTCTHAPVAGCSSCSSNAQCDDGNACTTDVCSAGRCQRQNAADGAACSDGNACNGAETCQAGRCAAGRTLSCDDGNPCTQDSCNPTSGCSFARVAGCSACTTAADCNDGEACTADACVNGRCVIQPVADGTSCTDGDFCDGLETCRAGRCAPGTAPDCNDDNSCTTDSCDPGAGQCTHKSAAGCCASDADCGDSDACTTDERCEAGVCVTTPTTCEKPGPCQESVCDPVTGCATVALADGTACDDGDPCTHNEQCRAGACEVRATSVAAAVAGKELDSTAFVLKRISRRVWKLAANGWFGASAAFDPIASGLTFAVLEENGTVVYEAQIPPGAFVWKKNRFSFKAEDSKDLYGLQKVELKLEGSDVGVEVIAKVPGSVATVPGVEELQRGRRRVARATTARKLTWTISVGDTCARDRTVTCPASRSSSKRCS
jgi:hypothetical protein